MTCLCCVHRCTEVAMKRNTCNVQIQPTLTPEQARKLPKAKTPEQSHKKDWLLHIRATKSWMKDQLSGSQPDFWSSGDVRIGLASLAVRSSVSHLERRTGVASHFRAVKSPSGDKVAMRSALWVLVWCCGCCGGVVNTLICGVLLNFVRHASWFGFQLQAFFLGVSNMRTWKTNQSYEANNIVCHKQPALQSPPSRHARFELTLDTGGVCEAKRDMRVAAESGGSEFSSHRC